MLLRAPYLLLQRTIRLPQTLGTLAHPGELTLRLSQVFGHLGQLVFLEALAHRMELPEELLIGILKGGVEFGVLPRPTRHLSSQPCEVIELLLETSLDRIECLLLCLIELVEGLLVDILGPFQNFFLALDQVSQLV